MRIVKVYDDLIGIDKNWEGIKSLIKVYRKVVFKGKTSIETAYFISSLPSRTPAKFFQKGIRSHWSIESFHWIKDVSFKEDSSKVSMKNAPENYSLLRNISINIFRKNGLNKIQSSIEKCANNVAFIMKLIEN